MAEIGVIQKTHVSQGFKFRKVEELLNALHPLFVKHSVFISPTLLSQSRSQRTSKQGGTLYVTEVTVRHDLYCAIDGSSFSSTTAGEAADTGDKSTTKAQTAAQKVMLEQIFIIPTAEVGDKKEKGQRSDGRTTTPTTGKSSPNTAPPEKSSANSAAPARAASTAPPKPGGASKTPPGSPSSVGDVLKDEAVLKFWNAVRSHGWTNEDVKAHLEKTYPGKQSPKELAPKQLHDFEQFVTWNNKGGTTKGKAPPTS